MQNAAWVSRQNPLGTRDVLQRYQNREREHTEKLWLAMFITWCALASYENKGGDKHKHIGLLNYNSGLYLCLSWKQTSGLAVLASVPTHPTRISKNSCCKGGVSGHLPCS